MVFSSARPVLRQLPAAWLAGVLATALLVIGGAVSLLSNGDLPGLAGWAGAVVFVPTLALALGVFSSGSKAFEVVYVIWWYLGPMQKTAGIDFISGPPQIYLLAAAGLLLLSRCGCSETMGRGAEPCGPFICAQSGQVYNPAKLRKLPVTVQRPGDGLRGAKPARGGGSVPYSEPFAIVAGGSVVMRLGPPNKIPLRSACGILSSKPPDKPLLR
jgi:hypothetical protein